MNKTLITFYTVLFCLTSSLGWSLEYKDLLKINGFFYKKFSDVPFTGKTTGQEQGTFKNGKKEGSWFYYYDNGQLDSKGDYKNGKQEGSWITYYDNGQLNFKGDFKNGKMEGYWVLYDEEGTIRKGLTGMWKDGEPISD